MTIDEQTNEEEALAYVTSVFPNRVKIEVENITAFKENVDDALGDLKIGSYLEVSDDDGCKLIAIIESYQIELKERIIRDDQGSSTKETYNAFVIDASPLGTIVDNKFNRGGDALTIPPTEVKPASRQDIELIFESFENADRFCFAKLSQDHSISVPVSGDKFFNKHFAIVGSSGSGKSHTVAKIVQNAIAEKSGEFELNNSHIIVFDIHDEYRTAFPAANVLSVDELVLPFWLLNSEELEDLCLDTEANDHNQRNVFKDAITKNKKMHFDGNDEARERLNYDSAVQFDFEEILQYIKNRNNEGKEKDTNIIQWKDDSGEFVKFLPENDARIFSENLKAGGAVTGTQNGKLINFVNRLESKIYDKRLEFLLGVKARDITLEDTLKQLLGYKEQEESNVTVIDLSGVPFEVLSITVSLISRVLFDYGYFYKRKLGGKLELETPLCLIYEEAHKYVPRDNSVKYRASRKAIERVAKEGRKYGVTMGIVSQRPSEISETIFSQCNNFIAMRLTNPNDQNYVKRLLPDGLGNLVDGLPTYQSGQGLLLGESIVMPSLVKIDRCDEATQPSSNDVPYLKIWKDEWEDVDFDEIAREWRS